MHRASKAAESVDLAVHRSDAEVIAPFRQWRPQSPAIGCWVISLIARQRLAREIAAERVELATDNRRRDFPSYGRHRGFLRPSGSIVRLGVLTGVDMNTLGSGTRPGRACACQQARRIAWAVLNKRNKTFTRRGLCVT
jgi:hypothetical protein